MNQNIVLFCAQLHVSKPTADAKVRIAFCPENTPRHGLSDRSQALHPSAHHRGSQQAAMQHPAIPVEQHPQPVHEETQHPRTRDKS
jgi:hypothetical protein